MSSTSWQWAKANPDSAARRIRELERENTELRNEIARLNNQTNWVCKCGGTDCEGQRENAALRADKERLDWLERYHLSLSRLTSPDMSGLRYVGQCFNPAIERGEGGPSYLRIQGSTIRSAIDAARKEAQP